MPFEFNTSRRHRIPRARYRVRNWPDYEAGLKRRGDLTLWIDEAALAHRRRELHASHRIESGAYAQLRCEKLLVIVPGVTHLFEEPGTLDAVAQLARDWFERFLRRTA
jgi:hypothetical protein